MFHEPKKILHHSSGRGYVSEKIILDPQQNPPATEKSQIPPCTHFPGEEKKFPTGKIQLTGGTSLANSTAAKPAVTKLQNGCHVCLFFFQVIPIGGAAATHF